MLHSGRGSFKKEFKLNGDWTLLDIGQWPHGGIWRLKGGRLVTVGWQEGGSTIVD